MSERVDLESIRASIFGSADIKAYPETWKQILALLKDRDEQEQRAETLAAEVERLRDALATYADRAQWIRYGNSIVPSYEFRDGSAPWTVACAALAAPAPAERGTA